MDTADFVVFWCLFGPLCAALVFGVTGALLFGLNEFLLYLRRSWRKR